MTRRAVLASVSGAVLVAALLPAATSAAPAPKPPGPAPEQGQRAQLPRGDRDGDRVSDDFAPRLRAAGAAEKVAVIIRGVSAEQAAVTVGPFRVTHRLPIIDGFSAVMGAAQARALAKRPGVLRVEADGVVRALDDATNADFGADAARLDRAGLDGSGVGICVVDTGADPGHEQIAPRAVTFKDFVGTRTTAYDDHGHGTHVMSIAAGDGTGGGSAATFRGVAPAASLYAAKVLDSSGYGSDSDVIAGIQWCQSEMSLDVPNGVDVISMSLGDTIVSDGTDAVSQAVNAAQAGGDAVVVAAGNSGDVPQSINAPGVATGAITVGAVSDWSAPVGTARHDDGIWLASFSSRGPTIDGRTKPDIAAPGVSVTAADAGTTASYVTMSGTSMATPYVAGAVALAAEAAPTATPGTLRAALTGTAIDRGAAGADNEFGAGLIDVRAFVDAAAGLSPVRHNGFPAWDRQTGSVGRYGSTDLSIAVPGDGLGVPLAVTLTQTSGHVNCDLYCQIGLSAGEWTPDLDLELYDPNGNLVADSQCALSGVTCTTGRQETVAIRPQVAGTYRLHVYVWSGGDGLGGSFDVDVSRGPLGGSSTEPPPPPTNQPPVANAGPDRSYRINRTTKEAAFTLDGRGSSDPENATLSYAWSLNGVPVGSTATVPQSKPVGTYTYDLVVTDPGGLSGQDSVTIKVRK
jgi:serine protease AprX